MRLPLLSVTVLTDPRNAHSGGVWSDDNAERLPRLDIQRAGVCTMRRQGLDGGNNAVKKAKPVAELQQGDYCRARPPWDKGAHVGRVFGILNDGQIVVSFICNDGLSTERAWIDRSQVQFLFRPQNNEPAARAS